jgi:glycosyltransferase involved in cell wall biosynthesis
MFFGTKQVWQEGNLTNVQLNGPLVGFGMNARRMLSWLIFELALLSQFFYIRKFKPDVVVVSSLSILTLGTGVLLKWLLGCKLVVEVRDIYPLTLIEIGNFSKRNPVITFMRLIEHAAYRSADLLVSPLENFDLHAAGVEEVTAPFEWIPMGFDEAFSLTSPTAAAEHITNFIECLNASGKFTIVYAGAIGTANALDPVFEAAAECDYTRFHFVFVGDGPRKAGYIQMFGHLPNVTFFGSVPKADVQHILSRASVLVNTWHNKSIYRFGISPNKLIDYALSGRPFITNLQVDLEILRLYGNGFVTSDESSKGLLATIETVAGMPPSKLKEIGERGRENLHRNFRYSTLAGKLIEAFERHGLNGRAMVDPSR